MLAAAASRSSEVLTVGAACTLRLRRCRPRRSPTPPAATEDKPSPTQRDAPRVVNNGHFDHYRPAAVLLRPGTAPVAPSSDTLDLAEQLFEKVNSVISD
jgi:hypothetical protein